MALQEEITLLEENLDTLTSSDERAELILQIQHKLSLLNSAEGQKHVTSLMQIAADTNNSNYLAWAYFYKSRYNKLFNNYDDALEETKTALRLFTEVQSNNGMASAYNNMGYILARQGNYQQALANFHQVLEIREKMHDKQGIAGAYCNIGIIHDLQGNYPLALSNQLACLKIGEETGDKAIMASTYPNIATVYFKLGNYAEALVNHQVSLTLRKELGNKHGIAASNNNIGIIHYVNKDYNQALASYNAALQIQEEMGDRSAAAISHSNIGQVYQAEGEYLKAQVSYQKSLQSHMELGEKRGIANVCNNIGEAHFLMGDYNSAEEYLNKALKQAQEIGAKDEEVETLKLWYKLKKAQGDGMAALNYYERYVALGKELENEETSRKIANLQFGYQIDKKEQELVFEREKKEALQIAYDLLGKEKERSESLLLNILPAEVAEELKEKGSAAARQFENVTVFFSDFKDFTLHSERLSPEQLVNELHQCFKGFDGIMSKYNIEKIKTVGDAYLAVSGLPVATPNHAVDMVKAALEIQTFIANRIKLRETNGTGAMDGLGQIRVGIHSGKVVAGIVGVKKFAYDIWGDTVNTAARMEQNGEPGKVNISQTTYNLVKDNFSCTYRGKIGAKNKGEIDMYFVEAAIA